MKVLKEGHAIRRRKLLRFNILAALIVLIVSFSLMVTGDYASIAERKSADAIYNVLVVGSILYMAFIWISCVMTKPFWFPKKDD